MKIQPPIKSCNIPQSASYSQLVLKQLRRVLNFSLVLKDHSTDPLQVLLPPGIRV